MKPHILLVDDEPLVLRTIARLLEQAGYVVFPAGTPQEAMNFAESLNGQDCLLMTDVVMPEMNGPTLAKHLVSLHPNFRCLFMSGYSPDIIAECCELGGNAHFISKPFSTRVVSAKISEIMGDLPSYDSI